MVQPPLPGDRVPSAAERIVGGKPPTRDAAAAAPEVPPADAWHHRYGWGVYERPPAALYADPYGYHAAGIPSHAGYYQEMLQSHAKMEHDRYLGAREKIISEAEKAQTKLLEREGELATKEKAHKDFLEEREKMLRKTQNEARRTAQPYDPGAYPFARTRFNNSNSPFAYEQALLQKTRHDSLKKSYEDELSRIDLARSKFDEELGLMESNRTVSRQ